VKTICSVIVDPGGQEEGVDSDDQDSEAEQGDADGLSARVPPRNRTSHAEGRFTGSLTRQ
jgi:hypothetical protein